MATYADYGIENVPAGSGECDVMCPQCGGMKRTKRTNQRKKTLGINRTKQTWHCHHCHWKGGLGSDTNGYGVAEKVYQAPTPIISIDSAQETADKYLTSRGISVDVIRDRDVQGTRKYCGQCGKEVTAIAFPYYRNGAHINTTYVHYLKVDGEKTKHVWQATGCERILYGLDYIDAEQPIIICEGQIDALSFVQSGFTNVLSIPDGAPEKPDQISETKFSYLASCEDMFKSAPLVILAGDNDLPGQTLNDELARRIGREKCKKVVWPEWINDANEALQKAGPAMLSEMIDSAVAYPVEGIIHSSDLDGEVWDLYVNGYDPGLTIGLPNHDEHYRIRAGMMTIVTGTASHGKSLWLDHIMVRLARLHGWPFAIFSPENQPVRRHWSNLAEIYVEKPFNHGPTERMTDTDLLLARPFMEQHFAWILPEEPSVDTVLDRARVLVYQMGIKGLVMDPWNELEHARPAHKSETEYISECLGKIRRFARAYDVHVWVLAHPTKLSRQGLLATDGPPKPTLNEIGGSVHFQNKADYGIVVWRNPKDQTKPSEIIVEKVRFRETGYPGVIQVGYDPANRQMVEV